MYSLCLDCGATNVRAMVVDKQGVIVGKASQPNATLPGEENPEFHIWDADRIFRQISECAVKALEGLNAEQVTAATITTFGVDGALVDEAGNLLYPVISWKCPRTAEVMKNIGKYISQEELNRISGVGAFAFNTIYKLVWLKENHPELLEKAHAWLFISNLLAYKLTGIMATDRTMAGTSQLTDLETGDFSEFILNRLSLSYDTMDAEADAVPPGCDGVTMVPDFLASGDRKGSINGLVLGRTRGHIYRAAMEALTWRLKSRLRRLESVGGFKSEFLILVGGGARNSVWTQMRADILRIPVKVSEVSESTVLGASMFAFAGAGVYSTPEQARAAFGITYRTYMPGSQEAAYEKFNQ